MRVLVVFSHPCPESFNAAICKTVVSSLEAEGHEVKLTDLYTQGFGPVMSAQERRNYHTPQANTLPVAGHLADIMWCQAVIFIYPTWWFGVPAMLKGWLERVWVPYETFDMPTADRPMQPRMQHISHMAVITTCGATWWQSKLIGEPGRKTLLRGIRFLCRRRCRTMYLAKYKMDSSTPESRAEFLARAGRKVAALMAR
ncbi:NAD(P)H-dependent oxidoreductase [Roseibium salinum]|uniref:NAD(P)H-dependent oxidoreductase n=1 Tax=Roseibium salinum TaxID=1604349 RepID=A0ABT3R4W0_9HYPH|nr:NAD(P)H-dependent oxidoreductase [Roseibium sp. DSM 29163]MCX2724260.1 NAD(P)H-dependent oxidoreductase [Roseibium sp. DSM 29163]MDN3721683.1 NAD(P)H-dependent oxidoreductase [Roseibium salinum]